ncbi:MAG: helix-turn-helix transcriptional regulator, partial [bacterium]|nr:helix-turn-helix transcriptional regulator [bacterium]
MLKRILPPIYRRLRRRAGLSQGQLATYLEVHRTTVIRWETGQGRPDLAQEQELLDLASCSSE